MIRKTITVTEQQNDWIKAELSQGGYGNESELIRDLIRDRQRQQQRYHETSEEVAYIREKLEAAEKGGFTTLNKEDMRRKFKHRPGLDG
jgi:antitoxin ParD1/3/4